MGDIDVPFMTWHLAILGIPLFWASIVLGILQFWEFHSPGHSTALGTQQSRPGFYRSPFRSFCSVFSTFAVLIATLSSWWTCRRFQDWGCNSAAECLPSLRWGPRFPSRNWNCWLHHVPFRLLCSLLSFGLTLCSSGCCLSNTMALRTRDGCDLTSGVLM